MDDMQQVRQSLQLLKKKNSKLRARTRKRQEEGEGNMSQSIGWKEDQYCSNQTNSGGEAESESSPALKYEYSYAAQEQAQAQTQTEFGSKTFNHCITKDKNNTRNLKQNEQKLMTSRQSIETSGSETRYKQVIIWRCAQCEKECIPVREQSRCLCGHRLRDHPVDGNETGKFSCKNNHCKCANFFYLVAEGAWILRCRCKHKGVDHDPATPAHKCLKRGCSCIGFDSPWVCNCDHPWSQHEQLVVKRRVKTLAEMYLQGETNIGSDLTGLRRGN